jgi:hypothetical protein
LNAIILTTLDFERAMFQHLNSNLLTHITLDGMLIFKDNTLSGKSLLASYTLNDFFNSPLKLHRAIHLSDGHCGK